MPTPFLLLNNPLVSSIKLTTALLLLTVSSLVPQITLAQSTVNSAADLQLLAKQKQWQHLLFYKNGRSEVISTGFYITDPKSEQKQKIDPYQELLATINLSNDKATVCKYPARYYWLNKHLTNLNIDLSQCSDLPDATQNLSLILVSSYLKNPASTFGHVLIKKSDSSSADITTNDLIEKKQVQSLSGKDLLNQSYNFGARIPNNESGVLYAIKGLFGIYDAGFSKADFFKQDAVYSKNEQRDMWEYELNLNEFNTALLNYHLYEAQAARFSYYFIKQNCGYRSGELLELISDIQTTNRLGSWYAPDYVFDQLVEHDQSHPDNPLIQQIRYLPSQQTQLRQQFIQLPKELQSVINKFIKNKDLSAINHLSEDDKALVLDFLITHRNYKLSQTNDDDKQNHTAIKKQLIARRFNSPSSDELSKIPLQYVTSPALSNKTTVTEVTTSKDKLGIGLTLFSKDPLNNYIDINKRFEAVKISAQYDDNDKLQLDEFVFLNMQQIENINEPLVDEPKISWQLKAGVQTDPVTKEGTMTYLQGGLGTGIQLSNNSLGYGFVNAHLHDQDNYLDISSQLGMRIKNQKENQAGELEYTIRKRQDMALTHQVKMTLRHSINKNNDVRLISTYTNNPNTDKTKDQDNIDVQLALHHYW